MILHDVEQNSPEWFALRAGRPTASEFKQFITSGGKEAAGLRTYAAQLAAELYAGKPLEKWEGNQWTDRGHALEDEARWMYSFLTGFDVTRVGFVTNLGAGCSPDGFVDAGGLVEIKCLSPKHHVLALAYWKKYGKAPPDYIPQLMGQLAVCERSWSDLFFYHPDLPPVLVHTELNRDFDALLRGAIQRVIAERDSLLQTLKDAA